MSSHFEFHFARHFDFKCRKATKRTRVCVLSRARAPVGELRVTAHGSACSCSSCAAGEAGRRQRGRAHGREEDAGARGARVAAGAGSDLQGEGRRAVADCEELRGLGEPAAVQPAGRGGAYY